VSEAEPAVTREIRDLADEVGARVAGIEHRVKDVESLRRKLADRLRLDQQAMAPGPESDRAGQRVLRLLAEQGDTLRYTLVIDDRRYASAVSDAAARLDAAAMSLTSFRNTWQGMRYRGINTTWTDPGTGVRFEVQFHTPATWRATVLTHPWYEIYRKPDTPPTVREELDARIAAVYAQAPLPRQTVRLTPGSMPPLPDPPPAAVDAAAGVAAAGLAGTGLAGTGLGRTGLAGTDARRPRPGARLTRRGR